MNLRACSQYNIPTAAHLRGRYLTRALLNAGGSVLLNWSGACTWWFNGLQNCASTASQNACLASGQKVYRFPRHLFVVLSTFH